MDCLSNLNKCGAKCCKTIMVRTLKPPRVGDYQNVRVSMANKAYYELHGCRVAHGFARVQFNSFEDKGNGWYLVFKRCQNLTEENTCKAHGTPQKPRLCVEFNEEAVKDSRFYVHPECVLYQIGGVK